MEPLDHPTDVALMAELGDWLARERLRRNMTQAEVAHEAGVSKRTVERLEAGQSVQLASLLRVLRALHLIDRIQLPAADAEPSPMEQLRAKTRAKSNERKRASPSRTAVEPRSDWSWDDEP